MASSTRSGYAARDTGLWTGVSLLALAVFFLGCGCFTMAEIFLGSIDAASAILAIVGVPLFIGGGIALYLRAGIG